MSSEEELKRRLDEMNERIGSFESWRRQSEIDQAGARERQKHMDARFDRVEKQIANMRGDIGKVLWIIGGAVLAAVAKFVLDGGLSV